MIGQTFSCDVFRNLNTGILAQEEHLENSRFLLCKGYEPQAGGNYIFFENFGCLGIILTLVI